MILQVNGVDYVRSFEKYGLENSMDNIDFNQLMILGCCPISETCRCFQGKIAHLRVQQRELLLQTGNNKYNF